MGAGDTLMGLRGREPRSLALSAQCPNRLSDRPLPHLAPHPQNQISDFKRIHEYEGNYIDFYPK